VGERREKSTIGSLLLIKCLGEEKIKLAINPVRGSSPNTRTLSKLNFITWIMILDERDVGRKDEK